MESCAEKYSRIMDAIHALAEPSARNLFVDTEKNEAYKPPVRKTIEIPIFFFKDIWRFHMSFWGIINMEISETLLKEAATMLIALTSRHRPSLIHGFQNFSTGLQENISRKAQIR